MSSSGNTNTRTRSACGCGGPNAPSWGATLGVVVASAALLAAASAIRSCAEREESVAIPSSVTCGGFDHDHSAWTAILRRYVTGGSVDYAAIRRTGRGETRAYLRSLESVCPSDVESFTRAQKLAFWINAYNAYTVELILDHYPLTTIRSIGLLPGAAFREEFIELPHRGSRPMSLNDIEHGILRREFHEPRIHFAIVCASKSCPRLRSEAYRADVLDAQLDDAARSFIRDPEKNRFEAGTRTLYLSPIFEWFREDFERDGTTLTAFVAQFADHEMANATSSGDVPVRFLDYDWSLNGR